MIEEPQDKAELENVPNGHLIEPEKVTQLAGDIYHNEAIAGDVFFIHRSLRLGSKG
jgi:3-oxoacyl-[acyl-carrier protein] reductase